MFLGNLRALLAFLVRVLIRLLVATAVSYSCCLRYLALTAFVSGSPSRVHFNSKSPSFCNCLLYLRTSLEQSMYVLMLSMCCLMLLALNAQYSSSGLSLIFLMPMSRIDRMGSYVKYNPPEEGIIRNVSTDNEAQSPSVSADLCHKPTTFSPGRLVKQDFSGSLLKNLILPSSQNKELRAIQTSPVQVSFIFFWKTAGPITSVTRLASLSVSVEPLLFLARSKSQDCTMLYMRFVPILPIQTS